MLPFAQVHIWFTADVFTFFFLVTSESPPIMTKVEISPAVKG